MINCIPLRSQSLHTTGVKEGKGTSQAIRQLNLEPLYISALTNSPALEDIQKSFGPLVWRCAHSGCHPDIGEHSVARGMRLPYPSVTFGSPICFFFDFCQRSDGHLRARGPARAAGGHVLQERGLREEEAARRQGGGEGAVLEAACEEGCLIPRRRLCGGFL